MVDAATGSPVQRDPVSGKLVVVEDSPDLTEATAKLGSKSTKETASEQKISGPVDDDDDDNEDEAQEILNAMEEDPVDAIAAINKEAAKIEAEAKSIEQAASAINAPTATPMPEPSPMESIVVVSPPVPAPKPVITIGMDGKPRVGPPAQPAVTFDKATGMPIINESAGAPVVPVNAEGKPIA